MADQQALYDGFIVDYYDSSPMVSQRAQDVAFYCAAAEQYGEPVLELGCGTGRVTMAIANAGHRVVGLDISERMLTCAEQKRASLSADLRGRVRLVHGDMTQFDLHEQFRCIVIPFRPFQHLIEVEYQVQCLQCVRKHLAPGGRLIVDFFQTDPERMSKQLARL